MKDLFIIPARKGSKGLPGKNVKILLDKPLIQYSIEFARKFSSDEMICISTDDPEVIQIAQNLGLEIPFNRPAELANDQASTYDVIKHALNFYNAKSIFPERVIILQPTSPFRKKEHLTKAFEIFDRQKADAVVSTKITDSNPYYVLYEENDEGMLVKSKTSNATRRQDVPEVYELNGSIYVLNVKAIKNYVSIPEFPRIIKLVMEKEYSYDIDDIIDFEICQMMMNKNIVDLS